jgi:anaerobic ribonucleoside-triphosphate reductase
MKIIFKNGIEINKLINIMNTITDEYFIKNKLEKRLDDSKDEKRQRCQIYSRVVGWITPLARWNKGKISEWKDRVTYKIK